MVDVGAGTCVTGGQYVETGICVTGGQYVGVGTYVTGDQYFGQALVSQEVSMWGQAQEVNMWGQAYVSVCGGRHLSHTGGQYVGAGIYVTEG